MFIFRRNKNAEDVSEKEHQIHDMHSELLKKIDKADKGTGKLVNKLNAEKGLGMTEIIVYAMGGDRRSQK